MNPGLVPPAAHPIVSPPTKGQATAFARAVNLQLADLPGTSVVEPEREAPPPTPITRELDRCVGVNTGAHIANIDSAKLGGAVEAQHEEVHSSVEVLPTEDLAARNNAASQSRRAISCVERFFPRELAEKNGMRVHYGRITITRLPNPTPGVDGRFGVRVAVPILGVPTAIQSTQPVLYVDSYSFLSGPAEVSLLATAFPAPTPQDVETRLLRLLESRAETHRL